MSNPEKHEPRPERGPVQRAQGLDPEITAQPRPIADELALEISSEPELSVDPEDLGSRFLSDAIEQGDFDPERAWPGDTSLFESPARDQPLGGPNFVAGNPIWEQTVDLETRTQGAADQLREPPPPLPGDEFDAELEEDLEEETIDVRADESLRVAESSMREFSLLDREGEEGDETIAPDIDLDEQGTHTRVAPRQELGRQVESSAPKDLRGRATPKSGAQKPSEHRDEQPRVAAQAQPQSPPAIRASAVRMARSVLTHAAWMLRRAASRLQRHPA